MGAGCSAEATRFTEPFVTGSTPNQREVIGTDQPMPAPVNDGTVSRTDLAPPPGAVASAGPIGAPPPAPIQAAPPARVAGAYTWSPTGGEVVRVGPGESLDTLAIRYGVPSVEIAKANGISNPAAVVQGNLIVIPVRVAAAPGAALAPMIASAAPVPLTPVRPAMPLKVKGSGTVHVVETGETLYSIAHANGTTVDAIIALNGLSPSEGIRIGQRLQMPDGGRVGGPVVASYEKPDAVGPSSLGAPPKPLGKLVLHSPKPGEVPVPVVAPPPPAITALPPKAPFALKAPPAPKAPVVAVVKPAPVPPVAAIAPAAAPAAPAAPAPAPAPAVVASAPVAADPPSANGTTFRWPVRGRIISSFGAKSNGERNDGINLAVPEGTSVKAAEAGTVIYAGNELPGYGNLVLIRHADGWVSAYAHNSDLLVKRGDQVMRGETIAHAGMTGSVNAPQVHFELRRGAKPVNPLDYLASAEG